MGLIGRIQTARVNAALAAENRRKNELQRIAFQEKKERERIKFLKVRLKHQETIKRRQALERKTGSGTTKYAKAFESFGKRAANVAKNIDVENIDWVTGKRKRR